MADVAEELMATFDGRLAPSTVALVVLGASSDLSGQVPDEALPELLHRLAGERLRKMSARG